MRDCSVSKTTTNNMISFPFFILLFHIQGKNNIGSCQKTLYCFNSLNFFVILSLSEGDEDEDEEDEEDEGEEEEEPGLDYLQKENLEVGILYM